VESGVCGDVVSVETWYLWRRGVTDSIDAIYRHVKKSIKSLDGDP
jgi:hypothetical protein